MLPRSCRFHPVLSDRRLCALSDVRNAITRRVDPGSFEPATGCTAISDSPLTRAATPESLIFPEKFAGDAEPREESGQTRNDVPIRKLKHEFQAPNWRILGFPALVIRPKVEELTEALGAMKFG